jgi:hypothetical protein
MEENERLDSLLNGTLMALCGVLGFVFIEAIALWHVSQFEGRRTAIALAIAATFICAGGVRSVNKIRKQVLSGSAH